MDWTPIVDACVSGAALIISASAAVAAGYIRAHVKNQAVAGEIVRAETLAAGVAHDSLTTAVSKGAPDWAAAKQVAIREGMEAAQTELGTAVTPNAVRAALAPLLAPDVSAPAGKSASATASAPAGGSAAAIAEPAA